MPAGAVDERRLVQVAVVGRIVAQPIGDAAADQELLARHDVRALVGAEQKLLLLVFWLTPIGKPLCIWITAETVQLPRMALATRLLVEEAAALAERQLDGRRHRHLVRRVEQAALVLGVRIEVVGALDERVVVQQAGRRV